MGSLLSTQFDDNDMYNKWLNRYHHVLSLNTIQCTIYSFYDQPDQLKTIADYGVRIASRGNSRWQASEGPEIIYNPAYISTSYNTTNTSVMPIVIPSNGTFNATFDDLTSLQFITIE